MSMCWRTRDRLGGDGAAARREASGHGARNQSLTYTIINSHQAAQLYLYEPMIVIVVLDNSTDNSEKPSEGAKQSVKLWDQPPGLRFATSRPSGWTAPNFLSPKPAFRPHITGCLHTLFRRSLSLCLSLSALVAAVTRDKGSPKATRRCVDTGCNTKRFPSPGWQIYSLVSASCSTAEMAERFSDTRAARRSRAALFLVRRASIWSARTLVRVCSALAL